MPDEIATFYLRAVAPPALGHDSGLAALLMLWASSIDVSVHSSLVICDSTSSSAADILSHADFEDSDGLHMPSQNPHHSQNINERRRSSNLSVCEKKKTTLSGSLNKRRGSRRASQLSIDDGSFFVKNKDGLAKLNNRKGNDIIGSQDEANGGMKYNVNNGNANDNDNDNGNDDDDDNRILALTRGREVVAHEYNYVYDRFEPGCRPIICPTRGAILFPLKIPIGV